MRLIWEKGWRGISGILNVGNKTARPDTPWLYPWPSEQAIRITTNRATLPYFVGSFERAWEWILPFPY